MKTHQVMIAVIVTIALVLLACGINVAVQDPTPTSVSRAVTIETSVPTPVLPTPILVTAVPTIAPSATATAKVVYLKAATPTAYPTFTPYPTLTPLPKRGSLIQEGHCWIFDLYDISAVFVDKTPVAPAFGGTLVCGSEVLIRR